MLHARSRHSSSAQGELSSQWNNPTDILSLLLIVGSDVVQGALAQLSGSPITPVCFSFGWVAYAFSTLATLTGSGRLMPQADITCKVINLETGYTRENKSWLLGRLFRDMCELSGEEGMVIKVFKAQKWDEKGPGWRQTRTDAIWWISIVIIIVQLVVAAIPWAVYNDWAIFLITATGTLLALSTGSLPQWRIEKLAARKRSKKLIAVTAGNGSQHILIFKGHGHSIDLEDLASAQGPKTPRSWNESKIFTKALHSERLGHIPSRQKAARKVRIIQGLPLGFWFTRIVCSGFALCWVVLLISTSGLREHTWFLICVGAIGMVQNSTVAAVSRRPETRGFGFHEIKTLKLRKVMDALMDLEVALPGKVEPLLDEYFPGKLHPDEQAWWAGQREAYDNVRLKDLHLRGPPAGMQNEAPLF